MNKPLSSEKIAIVVDVDVLIVVAVGISVWFVALP